MLGRLKGFLDSKDHTKEIHLAGFGFALVSACVWLTRWTVQGPRDANLVAAIGLFLAAATGGLFKKGSNVPNDPPAQREENP